MCSLAGQVVAKVWKHTFSYLVTAAQGFVLVLGRGCARATLQQLLVASWSMWAKQQGGEACSKACAQWQVRGGGGLVDLIGGLVNQIAICWLPLNLSWYVGRQGMPAAVGVASGLGCELGAALYINHALVNLGGG